MEPDLEAIQRYINTHNDAKAEVWTEMIQDMELGAQYDRREFDTAATEAVLRELEEQIEWEEGVAYE